MSDILAVVQARTGSTRLPGKVMYPLDGVPVLEHVDNRVEKANNVDKTVIATSTEPQDNVIRDTGERIGADVIRGSEADVLQRFQTAVEKYTPEVILRVTADCPLISPAFIDESILQLRLTDSDYGSAGINWTFPRGITCEAFTTSSFKRVIENSTEPRHREHVTPYYREHPSEFDLLNVESHEVYDEAWMHDRTDLRLTLDEPADYRLLETVYRNIEYEKILDIRDAIRYVDENELGGINQHVEQKSV